MIDKELTVSTMGRLREVRRQLVKTYPFFGELLMNLQLAVAEVGTACTDGKHLIVDPAFSARLSDPELRFLYMHEVLHVVFFHCYRRNGRDRYRWNLACDYTVNSNILMALGLEDYRLAGEEVRHQIQGAEAYRYTADQIYDMLPDDLREPSGGTEGLGLFPDSHEIWEELEGEPCQAEMDRWEKISLDAAGKWCGKGVGIAAGILRRYKKSLYQSQLRWKQIVRDFIRCRNGEEDYSFRPPDRRFSEEEFLYPGLNPEESEVVERIWFFIDTSGSITRQMLLDVISEIEFGLRQVKNMSGMVSFFDADVTKPISFADLQEFLKVGIPLPGGGTNFHRIFRYAVEHRKRYDPKGILILTDGYASFPERNPLPEVPVLWIFVDNPHAKPPFGKWVHISSQRQEAKG